MQLNMLKSKLHRAHVTHAVLDYEGSCAIDGALLDLADIRENEAVTIYNVTNGERFSTYAIRAEEGSGIISVNGAAAHKAQEGHCLIICCYAYFTEEEADLHKPRLVYMNEDNTVSHTSNVIPVQVA